MSKRVIACLLTLALLIGIPAAVSAEHLPGGTGWSVTFTEAGTIENNLPPIADAISGLQPGDDITLNIAVRNQYKDPVDWYIMNTILQSLEDATVASGGAYTYILTYRTAAGQINELYNSETVGGADPVTSAIEGLHEVDDALKEFFLIDTMPTNGEGMVTLQIALDGESQGNRYMDTEGKLRIRFAAEISPTKRIVKTGDETNLLPYILVMGISGALILTLAITGVRSRKKNGGSQA